jgi:hypothetical protein
VRLFEHDEACNAKHRKLIPDPRYEEMEGSSGGGGATAPPKVRFSSPKAGRPKSGTARGADLPDWLRDKRFRFFVGSDKSTHKKQSTALKVQPGGGGRITSSSNSSQQPSSSAPQKGLAKKGGGQAPQKAAPKGGAHGVQRAPGKGDGSSYGKAPHTAGGHASSSSAARQPVGPSAPGSGTGQPVMYQALRGVTPQEGAFIMYVESAWQVRCLLITKPYECTATAGVLTRSQRCSCSNNSRMTVAQLLVAQITAG